MSPEKQNHAIAEICGLVSLDQHGMLFHTPQGYVRTCPDYVGDLNAMHEAEKTLLNRQERSAGLWPDYGCYSRYIGILSKINLDLYGSGYMATAEQRAKAFLQTFNKFEEKV